MSINKKELVDFIKENVEIECWIEGGDENAEHKSSDSVFGLKIKGEDECFATDRIFNGYE